MWSCKLVKTPTTLMEDLSMNDGTWVETKLNYRSAVGSILYLAVKTRPDLAVVASQLARHVEDPSLAQERRVKRVLKIYAGLS